MPKPTEQSREVDRKLRRKYNIHSREPAYIWPTEHIRAFQHVSVLGSSKFSTYYSEGAMDSMEPEEKLWKRFIRDQAQRLVETTERNVRNHQSETKWRLDLEHIIYQRFELEIECPEPTCKGRWWRSEIEVAPENPGPIAKSIMERQKKRSPCRCEAKVRLENYHKTRLNKIFADRADNLIIHGGEAASELPQRKPDRVYGLQQTKRFENLLEKVMTGVQTFTRESIDITPFGDCEAPIIFPFLISESKTERGDSFESCERQTAFPIWKLLSLQERLQIASNRRNGETGGPFTWFFANRGEDWRVYGCYTSYQDDVTHYNIHNIWSGRVDSLDGALQILLIVDYIFDWARDLYRGVIYRQLEALALGADSDDRSVATDSDIFSLRGVSRREIVQKYNSPAADPIRAFHLAGEQFQHSKRQRLLRDPSFNFQSAFQLNKLGLPDFEQWQKFDNELGVFRPSNVVDNVFECVHITGSNLVTTLSLFKRARRTEDVEGRFIKQSIESNSFTVSSRFLDQLRALWTSHLQERASIQDNPENSVLPHNVVVTFGYRVRFSREWKLIRYLTCLAIDTVALTTLIQRSRYKGLQSSDILQRSPQLSQDDAATLVEWLQSNTVVDNFAFAKNQKTGLVVKNKESTGGFVLETSINALTFKDLVYDLHHTCSTGPDRDIDDCPLSQFATQTVGQSVSEIDDKARKSGTHRQKTDRYSYLERKLRREKFVLFCSEPLESGVRRMRNKPVTQFCVFGLGLNQEPPDRMYQLVILAEIYEKGELFFHNNVHAGGVPKEECQLLLRDETLRLKFLSWYRNILWKYLRDRDERTRPIDRQIDPIHNLPIQDVDLLQDSGTRISSPRKLDLTSKVEKARDQKGKSTRGVLRPLGSKVFRKPRPPPFMVIESSDSS